MNPEFYPNFGVFSSSEPNPLRFLSEMGREQLNPFLLQQRLMSLALQGHLRQHMAEAEAKEIPTPPSEPAYPGIAGPSSDVKPPVFSLRHNIPNDQIPNPVIIFKHGSSSKYPTPALTPEIADSSVQEPMDLSKRIKKEPGTEANDNSLIITGNDVKPTAQSPASTSGSNSDHSYFNNNIGIDKLMPSSAVANWVGDSIYGKLPEQVMLEYDDLLKVSHCLKTSVINQMNVAFPVNYDYNPKKSRSRVKYTDVQLALNRDQNNMASRRSRQRKKYQTQIIQYSVDYDQDENFLLEKQQVWLQAVVSNLEEKTITSPDGNESINLLRKQCGFQ